jgi:hypothetical protein
MDNSTGIYQIWTCPIDLSDLGTSVEIDQGIPELPKLMQNYPNPFNGETEISFQVSDFGWVRLEIMDVLGQPVASLVNERPVPGIHTRHWNAAGLAGGIYFCRLSSGGYSETRKLVYVR